MPLIKVLRELCLRETMELSARKDLLEKTDKGLFCPAGNFYIDPRGGVDTAVVTHGHGDHITRGCRHHISTPETADILAVRVGESSYQPIPYEEKRQIGDVEISLHPAGHILGAAQVRISDGRQTTVVTGDYSRGDNDVCHPFEFLQCDTFIGETTFGLPVFNWPSIDVVISEMVRWIDQCRQDKLTPVLHAYSLGKAQRILNLLSSRIEGPVYVHGAYEKINNIYKAYDYDLIETKHVDHLKSSADSIGQLVMAPPSVRRSRWIQRFKNPSTAFASGWMQVRGFRRRQGYDRGFVVSDHADFAMLEEAVTKSAAKRVFTMYGYEDFFSRYLRSKGVEAAALNFGEGI